MNGSLRPFSTASPSFTSASPIPDSGHNSSTGLTGSGCSRAPNGTRFVQPHTYIHIVAVSEGLSKRKGKLMEEGAVFFRHLRALLTLLLLGQPHTAPPTWLTVVPLHASRFCWLGRDRDIPSQHFLQTHDIIRPTPIHLPVSPRACHVYHYYHSFALSISPSHLRGPRVHATSSCQSPPRTWWRNGLTDWDSCCQPAGTGILGLTYHKRKY